MALEHGPARPFPLRPTQLVVAAAILLLGAWLRWRGAQGELWLDEIWSLDTALGLGAWHEAFWKTLYDNNHPLNTLWLYAMGDGHAPWAYRLHSVVIGTLAAAVAGWAAARGAATRRGQRLLTAMLLAAVLYPFVHFGSEARGYATLALCAYGVFMAAEDGARGRFALFALLGTLAHLSMLPLAALMAAGFAARRIFDGADLSRALDDTVRLVVPFCGALLVYVLAVIAGQAWGEGAFLAYGGSTAPCPEAGCFAGALGELTRFSTGGFGEDHPGLYAVMYLLLTGGACAWLGALMHHRAPYYAAVLVGAPLVFFVLGQPALPHGRYFFAVFSFLPLLLADLLAELAARGRLARTLGGLSLLALVASNAYAFTRFAAQGRGDVESAVSYLAARHQGGRIVTGTDIRFQFDMAMGYTAARVAPGLQVETVRWRDISAQTPPWVVTVTKPVRDMPQTLCFGATLYTLESAHGYWGLSGSAWGVYALTPGGC